MLAPFTGVSPGPFPSSPGLAVPCTVHAQALPHPVHDVQSRGENTKKDDNLLNKGENTTKDGHDLLLPCSLAVRQPQPLARYGSPPINLSKLLQGLGGVSGYII